MELIAVFFLTLVWPVCFAQNPVDNFDLTSKLYKSLRPEKDFIIAVTAIEQSLFEIYGAAAEGSATRKQIADVGFQSRDPRFIPIYAKILKTLPEIIKGLETAIVIAVDKKYKIAYKYKNFLKSFLPMQNESSIIKGDFLYQADEILFRINDYISKATSGQIKNFLPSGFIKPSTAIVMANAVQIKAKWQIFFRKTFRKLPFHTFGGSELLVDMIVGTAELEDGYASYYSDEKVEGLKLSTEYRSISMYILLPKNAPTIKEFQEFAESNYISKILEKPDGFKKYSISIRIPCFEIQETFNLKESLQKAGIRAPFNKFEADFSKLLSSPQQGFHISEMLQTARIKVDEKGFEAAGAVAMSLIDRMSPQKTFFADKPFHFYVTYAHPSRRQKSTAENVIFAGQYVGVSS